MYKKDTTRLSWFWFNLENCINIIHCINRLKEKKQVGSDCGLPWLLGAAAPTKIKVKKILKKEKKYNHLNK